MGETTVIITIILANVIFLTFVGGIIMFIRQYRLKKGQHEEELKHKEELHQKELLETQLEIQKQTMAQIGREIHDNIGQKLTLASIYVKQLGHESHSDEEYNNTAQIDKILNESLAELRSLSKTLTNTNINSYTIQKLIEQEVKKVKNLKKCHVERQLDYSISIKSNQIKTVLVRVMQEFIQNSLKHAECEIISISLQKIGSEIHLIIKDDGKGFDANKKIAQGIGLKNIKKRVKIVGGKYQLNSEINIGTELIIKIPQA